MACCAGCPAGAPPANVTFFCHGDMCYSYANSRTGYEAAAAACQQSSGNLVLYRDASQQVR